METVRDILAAHHSGISKPGLLAWARLRIDTAMTEAQLDEELARLGDEVVDVDGFLYLRAYVDPSRRRPGTAAAPPAPALTSVQPVSSPTPDRTRSRPAPPRVGSSGFAKLIGVGVFLWWLLSFIGGLIEPGTETTRTPTDTAPPGGTEIAWSDLGIGDCFTYTGKSLAASVRWVACEQPHGYEMFEVVDHPGAAFPDQTAFESFVAAVCPPAFTSFTGTAFEDQQQLTWYWWAPDEDEWRDGTRTVSCMLALADGSLVDRSFRAATP